MSLARLKNTPYHPITQAFFWSTLLAALLIGGSVFANTLPAPVKIGLPFE